MSSSFTLSDAMTLSDLHVFLGRAMRIEDGSVRLIAGSGVLAVYVPVLHPSGLLDDGATVLGLRTFAINSDEEFDVVVPIRSLHSRVEGRVPVAAEVPAEPVSITLPMQVNTVMWAAISPPRGGWRALEATSSALLGSTADAGIAEIAEAIPSGTGEQIVQRVRTQVWGRGIDGLDFVPAGAGFAALSLGFLGEVNDRVAVYESGTWTRLTTRGGHVLVKRRAWSLAR